MARRNRPISTSVVTLGLLIAAPWSVAALGQEKEDEGRLSLVESVPRAELDAVVSATVSPDGKFLYATSWKAGAVTAFALDPGSGKLGHRQTVANANLAGTTSLSLSTDARLAVATAFQSTTAVLYERDPATGGLSETYVAADEADGVTGLRFPIRAAFSIDGRFVYVLDARGPGDGGDGGGGAVTVFRVDAGRLVWVESNSGKDNCFANCRGLAVHPDGKTLLVASSSAGTLVVLDRDKGTGKTTVRRVVKDEEDGVHGLAGAMGVALSPDGRFAYTSAGRFQGDSAVSAFRVGGDDGATVLQEFQNGAGVLSSFEGGNGILVSPDGRNVYAAATLSGSVACFRRDRESGKLTFLETLSGGGKNGSLAGAAGLGISPDGRFVYVAAEDDGALTVFRRNTGR